MLDSRPLRLALFIDARLARFDSESRRACAGMTGVGGLGWQDKNEKPGPIWGPECNMCVFKTQERFVFIYIYGNNFSPLILVIQGIICYCFVFSITLK